MVMNQGKLHEITNLLKMDLNYVVYIWLLKKEATKDQH